MFEMLTPLHCTCNVTPYMTDICNPPSFFFKMYVFFCTDSDYTRHPADLKIFCKKNKKMFVYSTVHPPSPLYKKNAYAKEGLHTPFFLQFWTDKRQKTHNTKYAVWLPCPAPFIRC